MSQSETWRGKFFTIWIGQQLSLVGSSIGSFALVWWVTEKTGSATVLATASLVAFVPSLVLGPFVGTLVDRWNRRNVMVLSDGFIALVSLWLAYLFWTGTMQIWHVYVVMLARSLGGSFHGPSMAASTTLLVPKEHYTRVAGLNHTLMGVLSLVGPPLGALALEFLPLHGVMMIDVGTAAFAILPLLFMAIPHPPRDQVEATRTRTVWQNTLEGVRFLVRWPGMLALAGLLFAMKIAFMPTAVLNPLLIKEGFGRGAPALALFQSFSGAGAIAGGLLMSAWGGFHRKIHTILFGLAALGLGIFVVGMAPTEAFWVALIGGGVAGVAQAIANSPFTAILQSTVPPEMQGRVFSSLGSLLSLSTPIALAIAGPVSDWLGIRFFYVFGGIACIALAVAGFGIPSLRRLEDQAREAEQANGGSA